jgi:hypothetical protein
MQLHRMVRTRVTIKANSVKAPAVLLTCSQLQLLNERALGTRRSAIAVHEQRINLPRQSTRTKIEESRLFPLHSGNADRSAKAAANCHDKN